MASVLRRERYMRRCSALAVLLRAPHTRCHEARRGSSCGRAGASGTLPPHNGAAAAQRSRRHMRRPPQPARSAPLRALPLFRVASGWAARAPAQASPPRITSSRLRCALCPSCPPCLPCLPPPSSSCFVGGLPVPSSVLGRPRRPRTFNTRHEAGSKPVGFCRGSAAVLPRFCRGSVVSFHRSSTRIPPLSDYQPEPFHLLSEHFCRWDRTFPPLSDAFRPLLTPFFHGSTRFCHNSATGCRCSAIRLPHSATISTRRWRTPTTTTLRTKTASCTS